MAGSNSRLPQAVSFDENLGLEIVAIHPDSGNLAQLVPTRPAARNENRFWAHYNRNGMFRRRNTPAIQPF
jgi:hypothetical protein